jgi:hypothetical protein
MMAALLLASTPLSQREIICQQIPYNLRMSHLNLNFIGTVAD